MFIEMQSLCSCFILYAFKKHIYLMSSKRSSAVTIKYKVQKYSHILIFKMMMKKKFLKHIQGKFFPPLFFQMYCAFLKRDCGEINLN